MEDYKILMEISINHEYFEGKENGVMDLQLCPESLILLKNRQLIFKREKDNQWILLGNMEGAGVDEDRDVLWLDFILKDAAFLHYTDWEGYNPGISYQLDLSGLDGKIQVAERLQTMTKKKAGVILGAKLGLTMEMYRRARKGRPYRVSLDFTAKEMVWEYWFIQRQPKSCRLILEEQNRELLFTEPELFQSESADRPIFKCLSCSAVKMKEHYHFRMDLSEIVRENPELKRKLLRNIECPAPGQFHDLKGNYLRKIVYF